MVQPRRIFVNFGTNVDQFIRTTLRVPFRLHVRYKRIVSPAAQTYVMIHGLADTGELWRPVVKMLPDDVNYVVVDLLGHGDSRHFSGRVYNSDYQARNVLATCLTLGCIGPYTFIGHSFGSIVAIECAKRYPYTKQLVLCSLPLYKKPSSIRRLDLNNTESILFEIYRQSLRHSKGTVAIYNLIDKLHLGGSSTTTLRDETFWAFKETLRSGIMSQKTAENLLSLKLPIKIIYGKFDPLIIGKNISAVAKAKPNIEVEITLSDHALRGPMLKAIEATLTKQQ